MNERKYPTSFFVIGFMMNILLHFFWLFIPGVVLVIIGAFFEPCLYAGLIILGIDVLVSFFEQLKLRRVFLEDSDNPDFQAFQDMLSRDGNWVNNIKEYVEMQIEEQDPIE